MGYFIAAVALWLVWRGLGAARRTWQDVRLIRDIPLVYTPLERCAVVEMPRAKARPSYAAWERGARARGLIP